MSAVLAFLHHVAAFALVAGIAMEFVLRVMYFEKGAAFYMNNAAFIATQAPDAAVAAIRRVLHLELVG